MPDPKTVLAELTLVELHQLHRRIEQRRLEVDDWPVVCALIADALAGGLDWESATEASGGPTGTSFRSDVGQSPSS